MISKCYKNIVPVILVTLSISYSSEAMGSNLSRLLTIQKEHHDSLPKFLMDMLVDTSKRRVESIVDQHYVDGLPNYVGGKEWKCLAEALYFEARGESVIGQFAVAEVIINRANSSKFPNTICGVVNQGANKSRYKCQFTYMCDGLYERVDDKFSFSRAGKIAGMTLWDVNINLTKGALYYHAKSVNPSWSKKLVRTGIIGDHKFYSDKTSFD
jgi:spore germination cell wall hydrolase CwlJ-like protein